jgi:hypothetical protein
MLREQKQQLWCVSKALRNLAYAPESKLTGTPRFRVTAWFEQVLQVQVAEKVRSACVPVQNTVPCGVPCCPGLQWDTARHRDWPCRTPGQSRSGIPCRSGMLTRSRRGIPCQCRCGIPCGSGILLQIPLMACRCRSVGHLHNAAAAGYRSALRLGYRAAVGCPPAAVPVGYRAALTL